MKLPTVIRRGLTQVPSLLAGALLSIAASAQAPAPAAEAAAPDTALAAVLAGEWRSADEKARDSQRHPAASLSFWGLKPGATILEIGPGEGWWTQILAPYAVRTGGKFYATAPDLMNPAITPAARQIREKFEYRFYNPAVYGQVGLVNWGATAAPLPKDRYDFILISRGLHGLLRSPGNIERVLGQVARGLKPGGTLAIEQHRANDGKMDPKAADGYVSEAFVIEQAEKAGLKLVARSEINANPKDTKDHPFGVWTLPPTRTTVPLGGNLPPDPKFDHTKYDAIGESDRMTLRFTKSG